MGRNSRKQESGAEVIAKVQGGRTAQEAAEEYGLKVTAELPALPEALV